MSPQKTPPLTLRQILKEHGMTKHTLEYFTGSFDELIQLLDLPLSGPALYGDMTVRQIGDTSYYVMTNTKGECGVAHLTNWKPNNPFTS